MIPEQERLIDKYLYEWWGDYPNLAATINTAETLVNDILSFGERDGVTLDSEDISERALWHLEKE